MEAATMEASAATLSVAEIGRGGKMARTMARMIESFRAIGRPFPAPMRARLAKTLAIVFMRVTKFLALD
jgi:hypothetical protein